VSSKGPRSCQRRLPAGSVFHTSDGRDCGTRACTCQPKTCYRGQRGVCAPGVCNDERRAAGGLVYPVIDGVLGALVYGEGDGADEGDAEEGRPDTCAHVSPARRHLRQVLRTAPEAVESLASVCVADAVAEGVELVAGRGQPCLWRCGSCRTLAISS
jgi:hypothetical protein